MVNPRDLCDRMDALGEAARELFGPDDEVGTVNRLTPDRIRQAASLIRKGSTFNLDHPLDAFGGVVGRRSPPEHVIFQSNPHHRDDYLNHLYLQGTSHVDGLRHFGHPTHGFYQRTPADEIGPGRPKLGVNRWAERGIVGRGVLLDVARFLSREGRPIDYEAPTAISLDDILGTAEFQSVELKQGDILMIRTGWARRVIRDRGVMRGTEDSFPASPGLAQSIDILEWLWASGVALLASDNLAVEVFPPAPDSPFLGSNDSNDGTIHAGMMHRTLIPLLGMCLGELWNLDDLADDSASDGVWESFVVCKPLNLTGGVGSPANALAIK